MLPLPESLSNTSISRIFVESHTFLINPKNQGQVISLASLKGLVASTHLILGGKVDANVFNLAARNKPEDLTALFESNSHDHWTGVVVEAYPSIPISEVRYLHQLDGEILVEIILLKRPIGDDDCKGRLSLPVHQSKAEGALKQQRDPSGSWIPSIFPTSVSSTTLSSRSSTEMTALYALPLLPGQQQDPDTVYFLDTVKTPPFLTIQSEVYKFLLDMNGDNKKGFTPDALELLIRLFFVRMQRSLSESPAYNSFRTSDEHGITRLMNGLMNYVLTRCHDVTYDSIVGNAGGRLDDEAYMRQISLLSVAGFDLSELGLQVRALGELKALIKSAGVGK